MFYEYFMHSQCSMGGIVPKSYYLCNQETKLKENSSTEKGKCLVIPPRAKELLDFLVKESAAILRCIFVDIAKM